MIRTVLQWSDYLVTLVVTLSCVGLPALLALLWMSRRSENGLDWGSRPRLLAAGIALILVFVLMLLFSYIHTNADPWPDWYD
jgi:ABC-type glycerol-3-phosphate transport system permease component